ncbi:MAG: hypothetical protein KDN18_09820 [Verrucomicrobiae bacterium]|nr:hypothetical protein [Verrucomicrobiae bacterium]
MNGDESRPGITRLDQTSVATHGWQVRLQWKGVRFGRFFSDSTWGGREAALLCAERYRDRLLARLERRRSASSASTRSHTAPAGRNRSGTVGVTRIVQRSSSGAEYHFWQASWTTSDGRREMVRFSVLKYGEETALALAREARRRALE